MKNRAIFYVPLFVLFVFALSVLVLHLAGIGERLEQAALPYAPSFTYDSNVRNVKPEAEQAGLRVNDVITAVNGKPLSAVTFREEASRSAAAGSLMDLTVTRTPKGSSPETLQISVPLIPVVHDFNFYARLVSGLLFSYVLPTFSILLGFWVVFMRPRDYLAWILLFLLMGIGSIGLEGYQSGTLIAAFREIFSSGWGLSMLLFGIYFPERLAFDRRVPWLKWLLIIPLGFQVLMSVLFQLQRATGIGFAEVFRPIWASYTNISVFLNVISIGLFFSFLGWKSGTLSNPDARRRLRLMVAGTMVGLTPAFLIILYQIVSGLRGSFFDLAPWWFAIISLVAILLFPITMAYVIVVHRAMDVSVVIRQGIQYALASTGVKALQFTLLIGLIIGILTIFRNYEGHLAAQIGFVAGGFALIPLIDLGAKRLRTWIDRKFFRNAYDTEQILMGLSEQVRTMVETKPLLETLTGTISESLHVPQIALLLESGDSYRPAYALGYAEIPSASFGVGTPTVERLRKNEHVMAYRDNGRLADARDPEEETMHALNSQVLLPLGAKDRLSGILSLGPKLSEEPYSPTDLRLLRSVAAQTGLALENSRLTEEIAREAAQKERLNRELEIAREVQERLFPQELPPVDGLEYFGACRPALGVGGDYYDFFELANGHFGLAIGDVSGKGIGASLMMASLQASLRGQAIHSSSDLAALMSDVNRLVYEASTTNRYATFFYAQFDPSTKRLIYVNAGHNPPYVLRGSGPEQEVLTLEEGGAVVGMLPPMLVSYTQGEVTLRSGDLLVGFTDGISEAMNPAEEEWGEEAMLAAISDCREAGPRDLIEQVVAAADKFADGAKQHDDMTMIVVRVL